MIAVLVGLAGMIGCGDSEGTGGSGGGTTSTTTTSASGGGSGSGGSTTVTSGSGGATTGTGGSGTGGSAPTHCDYSGCGACKTANCNVVDNPCNGNPACESAQQYWRNCVCAAAGDATASAACDAEFLAVDAGQAQPIIDCVRTDCTECIVLGEESSPPTVDCLVAHPDCILCSQVDCHAEALACGADGACSAAQNNVGQCICQAQLGTGTVQACITTFETAGGALAEAVITCIETSCPTECPL